MYHSLQICEAIAEKLQNPSELRQQIDSLISKGEYPKNHWLDDSLMDGMPGIAYFYILMHRISPDERWETACKLYLNLSLAKIQTRKSTNCSLMTGLAGIGHVLFLIAKEDSSFNDSLSYIDQFLSDTLRNSFLLDGEKYLDPDHYVPPNYYNVVQGLGGILSYLIQRKDDYFLHKVTLECLDQICRIFSLDKTFQSDIVPSWFVSNAFLFEKEKNVCPQGGIFLSYPLGISGCLAVLAKASIEGFVTTHLNHTIKKIANWIKEKAMQLIDMQIWRPILPFGEEISSLSSDTMQRSWGIGWPAVLRSLYLAGKAIRDEGLIQFATDHYLSLCQRECRKEELVGHSFALGTAGFLAISYQMGKDTGQIGITRKLTELERSLTMAYDSSAPFGYQTLYFQTINETKLSHDPGLFNGALGIATSLLLTQGKIDELILVP